MLSKASKYRFSWMKDYILVIRILYKNSGEFYLKSLRLREGKFSQNRSVFSSDIQLHIMSFRVHVTIYYRENSFNLRNLRNLLSLRWTEKLKILLFFYQTCGIFVAKLCIIIEL